MDVFSFRDRVVDDYGQFSRSFTQIKAPDLRDFVDGRYGAGEYWPSPLIQLNPSVVGGGSISQLVQEGLLHPECSRIFRWGKAASNQGRGDGVELLLHRHQREAIAIARAGGSLASVLPARPPSRTWMTCSTSNGRAPRKPPRPPARSLPSAASSQKKPCANGTATANPSAAPMRWSV
jgi:hypothetical protein